MSSITGNVEAGSIVDMALCRSHRFNKATNILITKGDVILVDTGTTPSSMKTAPASANNKSTVWAVALETVTVADAKGLISACHKGPVLANMTGNIKLYEDCESDSANAGKVKNYVQPTVGASYAQAEVQAVRDDFLRRLGTFWGHSHEFAQGVFTNHTAGQFGDIGVIWIASGGR